MNREEKKQELAARAAWMYYVAGMTQQEIARALGMSRQMAQRLVSGARETGMVSVGITHPVTHCMKLARQLQDKFSLSLCRIVPSVGLENDAIQQMLAVEGSEVMAQFIGDEKPRVFGVGSGKTLRAVIDALPHYDRPQHQCVSLIGAIARDDSGTRYDVPLKMAEKMRGKYFFIPAPLYAENLEDKTMWCQHPVYQRVAIRALNADITFIGIGEVELGGPLNAEGFITDAQVQALKSQHVAGEMLGHFINHYGERLASELDALLTSVPLTSHTGRQIIAFSGGARKYQAIRAALIGQWITGLVTDEDTALKLLKE
ncbi:sugar-binding transcriptional regulator [Klebsiella michiganensis]|jgi:DNA-binding transcriptional regulator LsrR (DeoR family)|uniref:Sugar-binding transcriptional regulator n=1 Tax=Enterobacter cloacae TaxID=550 RepID=A0AAW6SF41_ENTCL|nr:MULTISPECIES: sugar-binding transcriptional regulator [Enterobacteriaceae]EJR0225461.1 sugar-binding transcriptional regulator [Raoultella planticola]MDU4243316.1 sugar-binding transcriptional regulator [Bifidobacterium longum]HBW1726012.1 sugar-binding transcriptional regulator [Klebsiella quasipneumoniae subsp. quasipneumoniae]HDY0773514.1 sugar-binding transcriptional regulator [Escherichia coli]AVL17133.1 DNA-binding transcriptional regulator [Enterobacter cloacae]